MKNDKHMIVADEVSLLEKKIMAFHDIAIVKQKRDSLPIPGFFGVGAGRCGTSALYSMLRSHPEIYLSPLKEVNYFGIRNKEVAAHGLTYSEYLNYFLGAEKGQVIGEISPVYLTYPKSLEYLYEYLPNSKIIITLRNHMERFYSQYKHHKDKHNYDDINIYISEALTQYYSQFPNGKKWYLPVKNLYQTLYFAGVDYLFQQFGSDNILIVHQEDLLEDYRSESDRICSFLGIKQYDIGNVRTNASDPDDTLYEKTNAKNFEQLKFLFDKDKKELIDKYGIDIH